MKYNYVKDNGTFKLDNPHKSSYLYFPLCNNAGLKSSITPDLHGDIKLNQNKFALEPVSSENLHSSTSSRNFWVKINGQKLWSMTGNSSRQKSLLGTENEEVTQLEAGFLYHKITRKSKIHALTSQITSFVPSSNDLVEVTKYSLTNNGSESIIVEPTSAIPIYGRSADNFRDHRQVTSLLNKVVMTESGISVKPTLSFDERGHLVNTTIYGLVCGSDKAKAIGHIDTQEVFIGEGGSLDWPLGLMNRSQSMSPLVGQNEGYEVMGGICFNEMTLNPCETVDFYAAIYINDDSLPEYDKQLMNLYCTPNGFDEHLEATKSYWQSKVDVIDYSSANHGFDQWMKWVNLQPILRRIYGCSFLPHHDYGRGGRGWRDLWQDCLALLLMEPTEVGFLLYNNYAGVRIDGSNATIIGDKPGEFIADRNNITRTWMDHGAWPWLTTKEYIHQTGDMAFLLKEQVYFSDKDIKLLDSEGKVHSGSVIEHLLLQNVSTFYNVGDHNILRLEDADWNDALDMAAEKGESVAFSCLYTSNLKELAKLLRDMESSGMSGLSLTKEMVNLFESVDYDCIDIKRNLLKEYRMSIADGVSGDKVTVELKTLYVNLEEKAEWFTNHIRQEEFITNKNGDSWFNSYYDNSGKAVEGDFSSGTRMMLTGQVFALMGGIADKAMATKLVDACKKYLFDVKVGGYRLNTDFGEIKHDLGRGFGFAYGHKENGAMFSHMAIMYCNALFKQGFVVEANELLEVLYKHCDNFEVSRIYPSVPEYVNERGRGMYTYLTGSASWLIYTVVTQMYGCSTLYGDLRLEPKLKTEQFEDGKATIKFLYNQQAIKVTYILEENRLKDLEDNTKEISSQFEVRSIKNHSLKESHIALLDVAYRNEGNGVVIAKESLLSLHKDDILSIEVVLTKS